LRSKLSLVLVLATLLAACGSGTTIGPEEPATVAELDAAVTTASQALLANDRIAIIAGYYTTEDAESLFRYDWVDYEPDGDLLAVYKYLDHDRTEALTRSAGSWMTALVSADDTHPWQLHSTASLPAIPALERLQAMATQATPEESGVTAAKQTASDGSALWTLTTPAADGTGTITSEWIVDADGFVVYHGVAAGQDPGDGATIIVYEYGITGTDADPVVVPAEGTPLVLDELGIPDTVRDLEDSEE